MDWSVIASSAAMILVAIIEGFAARERKKVKEHNEKQDRRAEDRAEESRLAMRMMDASLSLGLATAMAVERNKVNGELKAAKEEAAKAQAEYRMFIERVAAIQMARV